MMQIGSVLMVKGGEVGMTIRYIKPNSREDTCKNCPELDVNYNSDESYCKLADGEEVLLKRGQHRPEWCPKRAWKKREGEAE